MLKKIKNFTKKIIVVAIIASMTFPLGTVCAYAEETEIDTQILKLSTEAYSKIQNDDKAGAAESYKQAIALLDSASEECRQNYEAYLYIELGICYSDDKYSALACIQKAMEATQKYGQFGNNNKTLRLYNNASVAFNEMDYPEWGLYYSEKGLDIAQDSDDVFDESLIKKLHSNRIKSLSKLGSTDYMKEACDDYRYFLYDADENTLSAVDYREGEYLLDAGYYTEAKDLIKSYLDLHQDSTEAKSKYFIACLKEYRAQNANEDLDEETPGYEVLKEQAAQYGIDVATLGDLMRSNSVFDIQAACYKEIEPQFESTRPEMLMALRSLISYGLAKNGNYDEAKEYREKVLNSSDDYSNYVNAFGEEIILSGDYEELDNYMASQDPNMENAYFNKLRVIEKINSGDIVAAKDFLESNISDAVEDSGLRGLKGDVWDDMTVDDIKNIFTGSSDYPEDERAQVYYIIKNLPLDHANVKSRKALISYLEEQKSEYPDDYPIMLALAQQYQLIGRYNSAIKLYNQAINGENVHVEMALYDDVANALLESGEMVNVANAKDYITAINNHDYHGLESYRDLIWMETGDRTYAYGQGTEPTKGIYDLFDLSTLIRVKQYQIDIADEGTERTKSYYEDMLEYANIYLSLSNNDVILAYKIKALEKLGRPEAAELKQNLYAKHKTSCEEYNLACIKSILGDYAESADILINYFDKHPSKISSIDHAKYDLDLKDTVNNSEKLRNYLGLSEDKASEESNGVNASGNVENATEDSEKSEGIPLYRNPIFTGVIAALGVLLLVGAIVIVKQQEAARRRRRRARIRN